MASSREKTLEQTLVILKPDAVKRNLVGQIIARFEEAQLKVVAAKMLRATPEHLKKHLPITGNWIMDIGVRARTRIKEEIGLDPTEYFGTESAYETGLAIVNGCREYYSSGPIVALILQGSRAVEKVREMIGNTLPSKATRGTIRGDFGIPENLQELRRGAAQNLVHASDSPEAAKRETAYWFKQDELIALSGQENATAEKAMGENCVIEMDIGELEEELARLKKEDKYPHLAALIAYVLTRYHYQENNDELARKFYNDILSLLNTPYGHSWCIVSPFPILAGIPLPHYLHRKYLKTVFSRLSERAGETEK